jgi:hypothetical protein
MKRYKAVIVGTVIFLTLAAIAYSEPKPTLEEKMKNVKKYEAYYYGPRRMDVN